MKYLRFSVILIFVALSACQRDISGTYLANDKTTVLWLQIVRTPDNRLTGQLDSSAMGSDGKIAQNSAPVTGAVNARNVTITVSSFLGLRTVTLGGTLDGDTMSLSGSGATPLLLKRADFDAYQRQLSDLNAESARTIAAERAADARENITRRLRDAVSEIEQLVGTMDRFDPEADKHLGKFPSVEKRYQNITVKMTKYVDRECALAKNPNAAVDRSQLFVDANQMAIDTNLLHIDVQSLQSTFLTNVKPIALAASRFEAECQAGATSGILTPSQMEARTAACKRLSLADVTFRPRYTAMATGLIHLEQVYIEENKRQQMLLQSAQRLE